MGNVPLTPEKYLVSQINMATAEQLPNLLVAVIRACLKTGAYRGLKLADVVATLEAKILGD